MSTSSDFDPDLEIAKQQIDERIAQLKQEARQAISNVAAHVDGEEHLPAERKQAIRSLAENLDRQIALIESASQETLAGARRQLGAQVGKLKAEWEAAVKSAHIHTTGLLHESAGVCAQAMEKLDAELEAAERHLVSLANRLGPTSKK